MLIDVTTAYADTGAADLCFALGLPVLDALGVLDLPRMGIQLRLLGASHQVVLSLEGRPALVETVACLPGVPAELPSAVNDPDLGYHFDAWVSRCGIAEVSETVGRLREALADDPNALVGCFPGSPDAVTALAARATSTTIGWRTWHAYPQTGELVATTTTVVRTR